MTKSPCKTIYYRQTARLDGQQKLDQGNGGTCHDPNLVIFVNVVVGDRFIPSLSIFRLSFVVFPTETLTVTLADVQTGQKLRLKHWKWIVRFSLKIFSQYVADGETKTLFFSKILWKKSFSSWLSLTWVWRTKLPLKIRCTIFPRQFINRILNLRSLSTRTSLIIKVQWNDEKKKKSSL